MHIASMRQAPREDRYDAISMLLHWLTAALLCVMFGLGWYMVDLPKGSPERTWFFALHKSMGLTTALVVLLRLGWRAAQAAPPLPESILAWQRKLAKATHFLLYVFLVVQPLSGYLSASFTSYRTRWWGVPLPQWGWQDAALNELFTDIHEASSVALICLIILHVCGALVHLVGPDPVKFRMLPRFGRPGTQPAEPGRPAAQ